tara:strand:- start:551 stop:1414 length:864 start_codon:yes stop_codon:yes gene_type:complete
MHLSDNAASMHLVPVEDGQPRTDEMVLVDGVWKKPSQRRITFEIFLFPAALPNVDIDMYIDSLVIRMNHARGNQFIARRCGALDGETSPYEIVVLFRPRASLARSFLLFTFFPSHENRLLPNVRVEAWSWEQLTVPNREGTAISHGNRSHGPPGRTTRAFRGHDAQDALSLDRNLLLRYVSGEPAAFPRPSEEAIDAFVAENATYPAIVRRLAREEGNVPALLGPYEFLGKFNHHNVLLRTIILFLLSHVPVELSLVYEDDFECFTDMTWETRSASFSRDIHLVSLV